MDPERWRRIESLYHTALARDARDRAVWLADACGGDESLRREVEELLRFDADAGTVLEQSALAVEAAAIVRDHQDAVIGRTVDGYEVLAFLGAGGMDDVYRARDVRLGREVALKVFARVDPAVSAARFETEARAASALNHPNIVTIFGIGETDDLTYIAMELVEGETLRDRLSERPFTRAEALDVAMQLAGAMAAAHAKGIVHRDLKPENVMLSTEGRVKVLDFGIATLQGGLRAPGIAAGAVPGAAPGDRPGVAVAAGTARYMSPEQAAGRQAGHASDQFSFGVICHEMLTGRHLFDRPARPPVLAPSASDEPIAASDLEGVPDALIPVLRRCLARNPEARYASTDDLVAALRLVRDEVDSPRGPGRLTRRQMLWLGTAAAAGTVGALVMWRGWPGPGPHRRLVVLPFANSGGEAATEYLCDGITETLIRQLARLPAVTVIARATAFTFKGSREDPAQIGRRLGVDTT